jgi:predicted nucleic acid-binding protein
LIRAVLGRRVREILEAHYTRKQFFAPDTAFAETREHLPEILLKRGINPAAGLTVLDELEDFIGCLGFEVYGRFEKRARQRMQIRDEADLPVLATALALKCPIWTEDADFFGSGVATWTTDRVELFLTESSSDPGELSVV